MLWDQVRKTGYYKPAPPGPSFDNVCAQSVGWAAMCHLITPSGDKMVTVCPSAFKLPTTTSLGEPGTHGNAPGSIAEFHLYGNTISRVINHELLHLAYPKSTPAFIFCTFVTGILTASFEMQPSPTNLE